MRKICLDLKYVWNSHCCPNLNLWILSHRSVAHIYSARKILIVCPSYFLHISTGVITTTTAMHLLYVWSTFKVIFSRILVLSLSCCDDVGLGTYSPWFRSNSFNILICTLFTPTISGHIRRPVKCCLSTLGWFVDMFFPESAVFEFDDSG